MNIIKKKNKLKKDKLDILMLTRNDWANTGWRFSKCIETIGLNVKYFKTTNHAFGYPEQGEKITKKNNLRAKKYYQYANEAKVIHFIASTYIETGVNVHKKKIIMQHGGSKYRANFKSLNKTFNPFVNTTIIQMLDLIPLGAKNSVYISFPVDINFLLPNFNRTDPNQLIIGHYPTSFHIKGTELILSVIKKLNSDPKFKNKFKYIGPHTEKDIKKLKVNWQQNLKRVSQCDILIDACNMEQEMKRFGIKRPYGEWGNSPMEAAALGTIPITHSRSKYLYEAEYGDLGLHIVNNATDMENELKRLILLNDQELLLEKQAVRDWVVEKHSFIATGRRLWDKVYKPFFPGRKL